MFPKKKRKIDKKLLEEFHDKTCLINSNCMGQVVAHHVKHKGAGGDDVLENLIALCTKHHVELHAIGQYTFFIKHRLDMK